mmetsp:Transcript_32101/g.106252  ORF Transcript_32101/g.106252 Transcript_32101/m.106252 type:complete len:253 (+) Transcript_32101:41-799(+)
MRASRDGRDDAGRVDAVVAGGRGRVVVVAQLAGLARHAARAARARRGATVVVVAGLGRRRRDLALLGPRAQRRPVAVVVDVRGARRLGARRALRRGEGAGRRRQHGRRRGARGHRRAEEGREKIVLPRLRLGLARAPVAAALLLPAVAAALGRGLGVAVLVVGRGARAAARDADEPLAVADRLLEVLPARVAAQLLEDRLGRDVVPVLDRVRVLVEDRELVVVEEDADRLVLAELGDALHRHGQVPAPHGGP